MYDSSNSTSLLDKANSEIKLGSAIIVFLHTEDLRVCVLGLCCGVCLCLHRECGLVTMLCFFIHLSVWLELNDSN